VSVSIPSFASAHDDFLISLIQMITPPQDRALMRVGRGKGDLLHRPKGDLFIALGALSIALGALSIAP
jgi:hypothetical protein